MTYRADAQRLAASAADSVLSMWRTHRAGTLTVDEFRRLTASLLTAYNAYAARTADIALAVDLAGMGRSVSPTGIVPTGDPERLTKAVTTILAAGSAATVDVETALRRLATAEPLAAAQDTYAEAMRRHGVPRWTRVTGPDACDICRGLTGAEVPAAVTMYHHPGCSCEQQPAGM